MNENWREGIDWGNGAMVVATDLNNLIGVKKTAEDPGELPWPHFKSDMRFFSQLTKSNPNGNAVIMGKQTWLSLPEKFRPLPGRNNIVISSTLKGELDDGIFIARFLDDGLESARENNSYPWLIGGTGIYNEGMENPEVSILCRTLMKAAYPSGRFGQYLPPIDEEIWELVETFPRNREDDDPCESEVQIYRRKSV